MTPVILPADRFFASTARHKPVLGAAGGAMAPGSPNPARIRVRPPAPDHLAGESHLWKWLLALAFVLLVLAVGAALLIRAQRGGSLEARRAGMAGTALPRPAAIPAAAPELAIDVDAALRLSLRKALDADANYLQTLYKLHAGNMPNLSGQMVVSLKVDPSGSILEGSILSSTTGAPPFDQDVLRTVKSWKLTRFQGPSPKLISISLRFPARQPAKR